MRISQETFFKENADFNPRAGYARVHGPASSWDADLVKIIKIIKLSSMDGLHCKVQRPSSATSQAADTGVKCRGRSYFSSRVRGLGCFTDNALWKIFRRTCTLGTKKRSFVEVLGHDGQGETGLDS